MTTVKKPNSNKGIAIAASPFTLDGFIAGYASDDNKLSSGFVTQPKTTMSNDKSVQPITNLDLRYIASTFSQIDNHQQLKVMAKDLCKEHPEIEIDPEMLGGMPHIKGVRLSVGNILEKLYVYGSVEKIKEIYKTDVSEHQIKAAIAYAQDFLENACASR